MAPPIWTIWKMLTRKSTHSACASEHVMAISFALQCQLADMRGVFEHGTMVGVLEKRVNLGRVRSTYRTQTTWQLECVCVCECEQRLSARAGKSYKCTFTKRPMISNVLCSAGVSLVQRATCPHAFIVNGGRLLRIEHALSRSATEIRFCFRQVLFFLHFSAGHTFCYCRNRTHRRSNRLSVQR